MRSYSNSINLDCFIHNNQLVKGNNQLAFKKILFIFLENDNLIKKFYRFKKNLFWFFELLRNKLNLKKVSYKSYTG